MHSGATKINSANMQVGGKQVLSHDKYTGIQGYLHKRKKEKEREREINLHALLSVVTVHNNDE
jgi:hypothetical protein